MKDITEKDLKENIPLATRTIQEFERIIKAEKVNIGRGNLTIIAGPCTIESKTQIFEIAKEVKEAGADMLRGGVFKPLTFPYNDPLNRKDSDSNCQQGNDYSSRIVLSLDEKLKRAEKRFGYFKEAGEKYGLPIVSEIIYANSLEMMSKYVDMLQIGYRHMFNMDLIEAVSTSKKPILIKRHAGQSLRDLLGVCEHFEARNKHNFVVCERGVVAPHTHESNSRFIGDIQSILAFKKYAPSIPIFFDPSHATFNRDYINGMTWAAVAAGADGIIIEVHPNPEKAWVDPLQAINFKNFKKLVKVTREIYDLVHKS